MILLHFPHGIVDKDIDMHTPRESLGTTVLQHALTKGSPRNKDEFHVQII